MILQTFKDLGLSEDIVKALTELGIENPTPIQEKAIPMLLESATDFLGLAQTGTGKTAAFGLPLIEQMDTDRNMVQSIVLAPTRELAQQIAEAIKGFSKYRKFLGVDVVYGGAPISAQITRLKKNPPQILVATPGRMIDLINRKVLNLSNVNFVVLDEADEMLNMGFKEDIDTILSFTQHDKNIWLFSATMPAEIRDIVHRYMKEPREVSVSSKERVNTNIEHRFVLVRRNDKRIALQRIIDMEGDMYAVIFCRTKAETQSLSGMMADAGYPVEAIHGDLSQAQRDTVMRKFKAGSVRLLAATDVAARGIDVDNLTHVIHYDLPDDLAFYTHRSGRTARAGKKGVAIALAAPAEQYKINQLERQLGISFKKDLIPSGEEVVLRSVQARLEDLLNVEESEDSKMWIHSFAEQIENLSKEEILAKFITKSMVNVKVDGGNVNADESRRKDERDRKGGMRDAKNHKGRSDRDDRGGRDRGDRKDRGERRGRNDRGERSSDRGDRRDAPRSGSRSGGEEGMTTYFINLGKGDDLEKGELLKIICDSSGLRSRFVGRIQMFNQHSLFDVKDEKSRGLEAGFNGLQFKGRRIKVNPDKPV